MIDIRLAADRGHANFGWLDSKHTFSFGSYHDPKYMGYSALRVINDDEIEPGAGFGTHGHKDMEIISFVTQGVIAHKDSMGNVINMPAGEFQLMSAGTGVTHSEYNASQSEPLHLLQIWIVPSSKGGKPSYQQKNFGEHQGLTQIVTPTGENGTLAIKQDARLNQVLLAPGTSIRVDIDKQRHIYLHQVDGTLDVNQQRLHPGDGAQVTQLDSLLLANNSKVPSVALMFDLP
ncbi:pirin family protein [Paraglaciecola agarilytica]|uniref:pirin family protein n=1 Tax=Paraglaciecola chathamensis TaxID=368405 RepID=UPI001C083B87|nr:pirin family protein [Paraglaciecola agarilytica]MBU3016462.1 pirin family protein [Paraglaciecola agarilytica]